MATRTWVSGVGDDANPCSRTAPCKTFAGAISKTAAGGEISVIDPGGFGAVTITKGMTIDGGQGSGFASILAAGTNGIIVNAGVNDVVTIRNVSIDGAGTGIAGIRILAAKAVFIENCEIFGFRATAGTDAGRGIRDARASGFLAVTGTTIRNNRVSGVVVAHATGAATVVKASIDNCWLQGHDRAGVELLNGGRSSITGCIITGNAQFGIFIQPGPGPIECDVDRCVIAHNGTGLRSEIPPMTVRLSDTTIANNDVGISGAGGIVASYGNNRIAGNGAGNAPSPGAGIALL